MEVVQCYRMNFLSIYPTTRLLGVVCLHAFQLVEDDGKHFTVAVCVGKCLGS